MATDTNVNVNNQSVNSWQTMGSNLAVNTRNTGLLAGVGYLGGRLMGVNPILAAACPNVFLIANRCMKEVTEGVNTVAFKIQKGCGFENAFVLGDRGKSFVNVGASLWLTQQVANWYASHTSDVLELDLGNTMAYTMLPLAIGTLAIGAGVATKLIAIEPTKKQNSSEEMKPGQEQKVSENVQPNQELKAATVQS